MWNLTNTTTHQVALGSRARYITLVTSLTTVGALTLSANIILIITLLRLKSKHLKQSTRLFLIYKSLGHAVQGLGVMAKPHILFPLCVHWARVMRLALGVAIGGMFLLSLDSFITITKPYRHNFIMTPRMAKLSMFLFSVLVAFLLLLSAVVPAPTPKPLDVCTQNASQVNPLVLLIILIIAIFFIFLAMGIQGYNIWVLWNRSNNSPPASPVVLEPNAIEPMDPQPQNTSNNKNKATRLDRLQRLLTVWVISIFICWMPSCTMISLRAIMDINHIEAPLITLVQPQLSILTVIDGLLQPCLALALSQEIRSGAKNLFCCCRGLMGDDNSVVMNAEVNVEVNVEVSMPEASHI